jgi:hypothetical protein
LFLLRLELALLFPHLSSDSLSDFLLNIRGLAAHLWEVISLILASAVLLVEGRHNLRSALTSDAIRRNVEDLASDWILEIQMALWDVLTALSSTQKNRLKLSQQKFRLL